MTKYRVLGLSVLCMAILGLSACGNTLEGAGKDIEGAGEWLQDTF